MIKIDKDTQNELSKFFSSTSPLFACINFPNNRKEYKSTLVYYLNKLLYTILYICKKNISKDLITHVSPLRAQPQRYYMLDKSKYNKHINTLNGDEIAEVLKENKKIEKNVNDWLFQFGYEVKVTEFKEVVHHVTVKQNGLTLDISDVGFGISQVLPIVLQGFLAADNSITIIEQPEIHLHPTMQADMADLFIDISKTGTNRKLIIETHSEYLLKRLRRRISEGIIKANDVSICFFHPQTEENAAHIEELKIEDKGSFKWPADFYSGELLEDTLSFLRNQ